MDPDILEIETSIHGRLRSLPVQGEQPCKIHQVSNILRQVNGNCYEPQLVPVGPYHRDKKELKPMEDKKYLYLRDLLSRKPDLPLVEIVREIKELEEDAKKCYSESISLIDSKEFVKMMVVDGCFLVEIFLRIGKKGTTNDIFLKLFITHDMLLLENQLPFSVLKSIFSLVVPDMGADVVKDLFLCCFKCIYVMPLTEDPGEKNSYDHVLDMFHHHCLPKRSESSSGSDPDATAPNDNEAQSLQDNSRQDPPQGSDPDATVPRDIEAQSHQDNSRQDPPQDKFFSIRSAEELQEAGIKLVRKKVKPAGSFLDVEFDKKGILKIPPLYFAVDLQTIFLNLIAFEQCNSQAGTFFSGYAVFMDHLINTAKDVQILRHAGILEHGLGSDEALAQHFNEMSGQIFYRPGQVHLYGQCKDINDYCRKIWPTWRANLMRNYLNNPWAILSVLAAVLLLLLTATQTVFSIIPNV